MLVFFKASVRVVFMLGVQDECSVLLDSA
jgi:hypothetical protein